MYYFLSNLSFLDICYTSTTVPVMLVNFFREKKTISYEGCLSQVFFFVTCAGTECVLLAAMAYDRYVAICRPLQYPVLMSVTVCAYLVAGSWLCGLVNSMTHTGLTATLSLCGPNQISHFLCEVPLLLKLSCSDTSVNESVLYVASATIGLSPCLITVVSYILIISAILKIPSAQGRSKAFSTCASHLTVVIIFYGMANFNYDRPREGYSLDMDILVSVLFCIVTPMLNPIIYSLRNKEVKVCAYLVAGSWLCGLVNSMTHTGLTATLSLCGPNQISHFLCEVPLLLKLSCSDTSVNESVLYVASATIGLSPCLITVVSYILIISAILRIPSAEGRSKAFSTCASHLTVVIIFYGMANFNYDRPREGYSLDMDILVSVLFCIVTPMLNPIIYSLRNKEVKGALRKLAGRPWWLLSNGQVHETWEVVLVLAKCYSAHKAVIMENIDGGISDCPCIQALVATIDLGPQSDTDKQEENHQEAKDQVFCESL
ncbi:Olfactory receptor 5V1 [Tupaia chinensis]|uniref:Olfactory receptor 5V1 n=1 Tax=Tupaia chinensis TaxID=246437 RepID=L9JKN7_TUPCH|nr:Olfactory receptor 5V1 [Tupaia chinensis]